MFEFCIDRKLFGFDKWKSVKGFTCGLGRLDLRMMFYNWRLAHQRRHLGGGGLTLPLIFWKEEMKLKKEKSKSHIKKYEGFPENLR